MSKNSSQSGFAAVETALVAIIIAIIGATGWFVIHAKHNADTSLESAKHTATGQTVAKTKTGTTSGTDDASLNSDLKSIDSSQNQAASDSANANKGLDDSNSEITVPTN